MDAFPDATVRDEVLAGCAQSFAYLRQRRGVSFADLGVNVEV